MKILVFAPTGWPSGRGLAKALAEAGVTARRTRCWPLSSRRLRRLGWDRPGLLVAWGAAVGVPQLVPVMNGTPVGSKAGELRRLIAAGIPAPDMRTQPPPEAEADTWLPRSSHHTGGVDLLRGVDRPDFWTRRLQLDDEFRVHIVDGHSICVGRKVRSGEAAHVWVRSRLAGWTLSFDEEARAASEGRAIRRWAKAAVAALGYDFGAVDVGIDNEGHTRVLEVNSAPGLSEYTARHYAAAIMRRVSLNSP